MNLRLIELRSQRLACVRVALLQATLTALCLASFSACVQSRPLFDQDQDGAPAWSDCNDLDAAVQARYRDLDGDGVGAGPWDAGCSDLTASGFVAGGNDCNDQDASVLPGAEELCDGLDNDCNGLVDENVPNPIADQEIFCDGLDNNCNGDGDENPDADQDGYFLCGSGTSGSDCDDAADAVNPGAVEDIGDSVDTNCNGEVDIIHTWAGNGMCCFSQDGEPAAESILGNPGQLITDGNGNLYFADAGSHRIRKISVSGVISTVAGNGQATFAGDNGPAGQASLYAPSGITFDRNGLLYIADTMNHVIRRVGNDGRIVTILGQGGSSGSTLLENEPLKSLLNQPTAVMVGADGYLLAADKSNHRILQMQGDNRVIQLIGTGVAGSSGDGSAARNAQLSSPTGLLLYGKKEELLIADTGNNAVRRVDNLGVITTIVGSVSDPRGGYSGDGGPAYQAYLSQPTGLVEDSLGNLFIADQGNHRIRRVDSDGTITTVAGAGVPGYSGDDGPAIDAMLHRPYGVAISKSGFLLIGDTGNHRIREVIW